MTLACFFVSCRDGRLGPSFWSAQFDCHRGGFIVPPPTGVTADLDTVGQYDDIRETGFDLVFSILALRRSSEVGCASDFYADYSFLEYNFATGEVSKFTL